MKAEIKALIKYLEERDNKKSKVKSATKRRTLSKRANRISSVQAMVKFVEKYKQPRGKLRKEKKKKAIKNDFIHRIYKTDTLEGTKTYLDKGKKGPDESDIPIQFNPNYDKEKKEFEEKEKQYKAAAALRDESDRNNLRLQEAFNKAQAENADRQRLMLSNDMQQALHEVAAEGQNQIALYQSNLVEFHKKYRDDINEHRQQQNFTLQQLALQQQEKNIKLQQEINKIRSSASRLLEQHVSPALLQHETQLKSTQEQLNEFQQKYLNMLENQPTMAYANTQSQQESFYKNIVAPLMEQQNKLITHLTNQQNINQPINFSTVEPQSNQPINTSAVAPVIEAVIEHKEEPTIFKRGKNITEFVALNNLKNVTSKKNREVYNLYTMYKGITNNEDIQLIDEDIKRQIDAVNTLNNTIKEQTDTVNSYWALQRKSDEYKADKKILDSLNKQLKDANNKITREQEELIITKQQMEEMSSILNKKYEDFLNTQSHLLEPEEEKKEEEEQTIIEQQINNNIINDAINNEIITQEQQQPLIEQEQPLIEQEEETELSALERDIQEEKKEIEENEQQLEEEEQQIIEKKRKLEEEQEEERIKKQHQEEEEQKQNEAKRKIQSYKQYLQLNPNADIDDKLDFFKSQINKSVNGMPITDITNSKKFPSEIRAIRNKLNSEHGANIKLSDTITVTPDRTNKKEVQKIWEERHKFVRELQKKYGV